MDIFVPVFDQLILASRQPDDAVNTGQDHHKNESKFEV
jgi:hypothetical protein